MRGMGCLVVAALAACGPPERPPARPDARGGVRDDAAGVQILLFERPTGGRLYLSLWLDAGARDAEPPQLATVAAWSVAGALQARVLPDGTELARPCAAESLPSCLASLATAVATRRVRGDALARAMARLRRDRARALAVPGRSSDSLALAALLGARVDPFGDGGDVGRDEVESFLADHYGAGRVLLVVVGDVDRDTLRDAAAGAFGRLPDPRRSRAERPAPAEDLRVEVGGSESTSLATLFASPGAAAHVARRWIARIDSADASADVFPLRGGTALLLRGTGPLEPLVDRYRELLEEPFEGAALRPPDAPIGLARWHGARWASTGTQHVGGLGVGAVVDGGRGDAVGDDDPDQTLETGARERLRTALRWEPSFEGSVDDRRASAVFPNGASLRVEHLEGAETVAVAAVFEGGAVEDTPREHGITALLAAVTVRACVNRAARELGVHPDTVGVRVTPIVQPERVGFLFSAPQERWAELTYLAGRCARGARIEPLDVEDTRADVRRAPHRLHALADAISPEAPGRISPLNAEPPSAGAAELTRWRDRVAVGRRAHFAVVGAIPVRRAFDRLARIIARQPAGRAFEPTPWAGPPEALSAFGGSATLGAWVIWSAPADRAASAAASSFAAHAARTLATREGVRPIDQRSGVSGGRAWAAVFVQLDEATLDRLPSLVAVEGDLGVLARDSVRRESAARAWEAGSPQRMATALASGRGEALDQSAARAIVGELAAATPRFVVARPER